MNREVMQKILRTPASDRAARCCPPSVVKTGSVRGDLNYPAGIQEHSRGEVVSFLGTCAGAEVDTCWESPRVTTIY